MRFLDRLPPAPNLSILFLQHRPAQHESVLPELLAGRTSLKVTEPADGTVIEPNHLYIITPHAEAEVRDGRLHLRTGPTDRTQFTAVDLLFSSVAQWAQGRAIGVILSGMGSDGATGIREIKAQGGITIAQSPDSAKYDGMPRAAIETGMVDLVLTPEQMAEQIVQVRTHPYLAPHTSGVSDAAEMPIPDAQLHEIFAILKRSSGIDFRQYKLPTIKRRLLRRMAVLRVVDIGTYIAYLTEHPKEGAILGQDLLIHVTRFFREPDSFAGLQSIVYPDFMLPRHDDIRIWVPGCATGEEAYSVAISLFEFLGERAPGRRVQIFATDVSDSSIEQARLGVYPVSIAADVSADRLRRFFTRTDGGYRVTKLIRDMCIFARHDLTRDPPFSRLNLIVCRNVLIYLDTPLQRRLMMVFNYALVTDGFLMLGSAETTGPQAPFVPADKKWRIFRKSSVDVRLPLGPGALVTGHTGHERPGGEGVRRKGEAKSIQDEASRLLLDRYAPPAVVIDANLQILQFRGQTGAYLEIAPGEPNLSLMKMARSGLLHPLQATVEAARRRGRTVRKDHLLVQHDGGWREVGIEVVPLVASGGEHFLVLFVESGPPRGRARKGRGKTRDASSRRERTGQVGELRRELVANREYLQSIIQELEASNEELQSANEEILSSNEELQSTNEELDTAKEELQSMNEELNTLNEELRSRNEELTHVNSDLLNLLGSVDLPIVIVDNDLTVRRFTPRAETAFNLIAGDIGRRIGQINPSVEGLDLEALIRETIEHVLPQEREVRDKEGRSHLLRIRPYKTVDNRLTGAVLTLLGVEGRDRTPADQIYTAFRAVSDLVSQPLLLLDPERRVLAASPSFRELFAAGANTIERQPVTMLGPLWSSPTVSELIRDGSARGEVHAVDIEMELKSGERRRLTLRARPLEIDHRALGLLIAVEGVPSAHVES